MSARKEGINVFHNYKYFSVVLHFPRTFMVDNVQVSFGGHASSEPIGMSSEFRKLKHKLKQLFYRRSKDGYYNSNFIFVDRTVDSYIINSKGLVFFDVFLKLEDPCDRAFIVEHILTILNEVEQIYEDNEFFTFQKYNSGKLNIDA